MDINEAQGTLDALQAKLAGAVARDTALATERRRISFDANTGDDAARKALDKLNRETATLGLEIENLKSAIEEARRRVNEAEREEETATARASAGKAREIGDSLVERARKIDAALTVVAGESLAFAADITTLNRLGFTHPRAEQFSSIGERALMTALMPTPLKIRHLAPGEKRNFTDAALDWRATIENVASAHLSKSEAA